MIRGRRAVQGGGQTDSRRSCRRRRAAKGIDPNPPEAHATTAPLLLADDDDNIKKNQPRKVKKDNPIGDVETGRLSRLEKASWEVGPVSNCEGKRQEERVRGRSETPRLAWAPALVTGSWELGKTIRYDERLAWWWRRRRRRGACSLIIIVIIEGVDCFVEAGVVKLSIACST